jgi:hypothetical protein
MMQWLTCVREVYSSGADSSLGGCTCKSKFRVPSRKLPLQCRTTRINYLRCTSSILTGHRSAPRVNRGRISIYCTFVFHAA